MAIDVVTLALVKEYAKQIADSPDSSQNAHGLTAAQIAAIDGLFKVATFIKDDVSAEYNAFLTAFGISGGDAPDVPDSPDHSHSYTPTVTTPATCTTAGVKTYTCSCGNSYTESIRATGHKYVDGVCTVCGAADPDAGAEVEIFEPESNTIVSVAMDQASTLINVDTGAATANEDWIASDYVEIPTGNDYITFQCGRAIAIRYAFYDSEKKYIKGTILSGVTTAVAELPENAAYIRMSTNITTIGNITLNVGKNMMTSWGTTTDNLMKSDGTVIEGYSIANYHRISNGYIKIPDGASTLFWFSKAGFDYVKTIGCVYDSEYGCIGHANRDATQGAGNLVSNSSVQLSELTDPVYLKIAVNNNNKPETNNNPAEQFIVGYC